MKNYCHGQVNAALTSLHSVSFMEANTGDVKSAMYSIQSGEIGSTRSWKPQSRLEMISIVEQSKFNSTMVYR